MHQYPPSISLVTRREVAGFRIPASTASWISPLIHGSPFSHLESGPTSLRDTLSGRVPQSAGLDSVLTWYTCSSSVPLRIWSTLLRWKRLNLSFSEVSQHKAMVESPNNTDISTHSVQAILTTQDIFEPVHNASNSSFGFDSFLASKDQPSIFLLDQEPSFHLYPLT